MTLPETLEQQVEEFVEQYKRERKTTFVSRFERRMIEQGLQQGLQQGLEQGIESSIMRILLSRFGEEAKTLQQAVAAIDSIAILEQLLDGALDAPTLEAFAETLERYRAADGESRE